VSSSPEDGESRYRRNASPDPANSSFKLRIEFVVVDGPEGRALQQRQADVMRTVLEWIAQHRSPEIQ
jgi:hypothetical protein